MCFLMVFDFTQFWLDGWPGNEYFWISHKISGPLTPLTPLGVHPQCLLKMQSETDWSNYSQCAPVSIPGAQFRKTNAIHPKWFNYWDTNSMPRPNLSSGLKDLAVPELKAKMLFNTSRQSFILNQKNKRGDIFDSITPMALKIMSTHLYKKIRQYAFFI